MKLESVLHPLKLWRWYQRAAWMKRHDPHGFRRIYQPQLCPIGRLIVWYLSR